MAAYLESYSGVAGAAVAITGVAAATAAMFMFKSPQPIVPSIDLNEQSTLLPGPERARVSKLESPSKDSSKYPVTTLYDVLYCGMKRSNDGNCLGMLENNNGEASFKWLKYSQVIDLTKNFGSGLMDLGIKPGPSTFVGIYSKNSVEWVIAEHACYCFSLVLVPLYDTLGPTACSFIIRQGEITLLITQDDSKTMLILKQASETPTLKYIISIEKVTDKTEALAEELGIKIYSFHDIVERGKAKPHSPVIPKPDELATICYTSGTTSDPKGVMHVHGAVIDNALILLANARDYNIGPNDALLSFLPLAHMMERISQILIYISGGKIGFFSGNILELMSTMQVLKPTITALVPRLMNRLYNKAKDAVKGSYVKGMILDLAVQSKTAELKRHIIRNNGFWDRLAFKKIRDAFGGRIRLMVVGSAPTSDKILTFTRAALGCLIIEVYGSTESVSACTATVPGDSTTEHVGPPLPGLTIKLVDVPEMNYFAKDDKGEICVKGMSLFVGYYKNPEATAEVIDSDGWLHTGDVGMWLPNGVLKVIDRKKNIFKLSQGEYIAPEKIESCYLKCYLIAQVFVYGESLKSTLVGIVVIDAVEVLKLCKENEISVSEDDIYRNEKVKKLILNKMQDQGRVDGLKSFEQVKDIFLFNGMFSLENGLVTPTLKTKRPAMKEFFLKQIEAMYNNLE